MGAFVHRSLFTLGDTNSFGNVYFASYFTLTGIVRELWCAARVANLQNHLASGLKLITSKASCEYTKDFFAFDPVRCEMTVPNLRHASADLLFRFFHEATEEKHAEATQTIVFADANHRSAKSRRTLLKLLESRLIEPVRVCLCLYPWKT